MTLTKREYVALELLKVKDITVAEAYEMADSFIAESTLNVEDDRTKKVNNEIINPNPSLDPIFSLEIETLELSVRTTKFLKNNGVKTISQLVPIKISDMFPTSTDDDFFHEAFNRLKNIGLSFAMAKHEMLDYNSAEYVQIIKGVEGEFILKPIS